MPCGTYDPLRLISKLNTASHDVKSFAICAFVEDIVVERGNDYLYSGLSLRAGGRGFSPATKRVAPAYSYWKIEEK